MCFIEILNSYFETSFCYLNPILIHISTGVKLDDVLSNLDVGRNTEICVKISLNYFIYPIISEYLCSTYFVSVSMQQ